MNYTLTLALQEYWQQQLYPVLVRQWLTYAGASRTVHREWLPVKNKGVRNA